MSRNLLTSSWHVCSGVIHRATTRSSSTFFITAQGFPVTKSWFVQQVWAVLCSLGLPQDEYAGQFPHRGSHVGCPSRHRGFNNPNSGEMAELVLSSVHLYGQRATSSRVEKVGRASGGSIHSPWGRALAQSP